MLILPTAIYQAMLRHATEHLDEEVCGLLAGHITQNEKIVEKLYILENIRHSPEHFFIHPTELITIIKEIRSLDLELIGNWHSHPNTPAVPSPEDLNYANDSSLIYCILSLKNQNHPKLIAYTTSPLTPNQILYEKILFTD